MTPALLLTVAALAASCGPPPPEEPARPVVSCRADDFTYLSGEPIEVIGTLATPLQVRVLGPDDFVPRDFDPNRLTFTESPDGEVSRVFCG